LYKDVFGTSTLTINGGSEDRSCSTYENVISSVFQYQKINFEKYNKGNWNKFILSGDPSIGVVTRDEQYTSRQYGRQYDFHAGIKKSDQEFYMCQIYEDQNSNWYLKVTEGKQREHRNCKEKEITCGTGEKCFGAEGLPKTFGFCGIKKCIHLSDCKITGNNRDGFYLAQECTNGKCVYSKNRAQCIQVAFPTGTLCILNPKRKEI